MKQKLLLLFVILVIGISTKVQAYDFSAVSPSGHTLYYTITSSNTVQLTDWAAASNQSGDFIISDSVSFNGIKYSVTSIGALAFAECKCITSVIIPNTVTTIGNWAFSQCSGLTSVTIPNSVTYIGALVFSECIGLTSVTIPNSVTLIGECSFCSCTGLTSVTILNSDTTSTSVTKIDNYAFDNCINLTSVTLSNSVSSIGAGAFENCTSLTSITIPNSVTSIGGGAFCDCASLSLITIPNSVTSIGRNAFYNCTSLISITIPNSVIYIGSNAFYNTPYFNNKPDGLVYINNVLHQYKGVMPAGTIINIPLGTVSISDCAFKQCSGLTSVTIPNSVTAIDWSVFSGTGLTSITIPSSVTSISSFAFGNCIGLTSITCEALNPPLMGDVDPFFNVNKATPVYIPCSSYSLYKQAEWWKYFSKLRCIVGLDKELEAPVSLKIYPNPASDKAVLEIDELRSKAHVGIADVTGRVIKTLVINPEDKKIEIDVRDFAKGVYNVLVQNKDITISKKLIVE
ncbi:MAG: hypothetical protein H6Q15_1593 [Bacteroidetes bacterium]|nr:hypothetical protein [Bacteroidota bacterium]